MDKKTSDVVFQIADFVENDLDTLLEIALALVGLIPGMSMVAKIIDLLVKHRSKIMLAAGLAKKVSSPTTAGEDDEFANSEEQLCLEQSDPKELFLSLVEDAKADGVVTDEEREYLIPRGLRAGYSLKEIEQMLVIK